MLCVWLPLKQEQGGKETAKRLNLIKVVTRLGGSWAPSLQKLGLFPPMQYVK